MNNAFRCHPSNRRRALDRRYDYFYHVSTDVSLESIQHLGLDPNFEDPRSGYGQRLHEPERAMRYFTSVPSGIALGKDAAAQRVMVFDNEMFMLVQGELSAVLLARVRRRSLIAGSDSTIHMETCDKRRQTAMSLMPAGSLNWCRKTARFRLTRLYPQAN